MKAFIAILLIFISLFFSGCATNTAYTSNAYESMWHNYNSLNLQLSKPDNSQYSLTNTANKTIASATANGGLLRFDISTQADLSACLYVLNDDGNNLFQDNLSFNLPIISEFKELDTRKYHLSVETNRHLRLHERYLREISTKLAANRAFNGTSCKTPPQAVLPREPYTPCNSESECQEEGAAICYVRFFSTEGCTLALREFRIPGLLSSPTCAATAAEIAGQKYGLPDALMDIVHGLIDDYADTGLESDSIWQNLFGGLVKGANYAWKLNRANQCVNVFTNQFYGAKKRWLAEVNRIKREPGILKNACDQLLAEFNARQKRFNLNQETHNQNMAQLVEVNARFNSIRQQRAPVLICQG